VYASVEGNFVCLFKLAAYDAGLNCNNNFVHTFRWERPNYLEGLFFQELNHPNSPNEKYEVRNPEPKSSHRPPQQRDVDALQRKLDACYVRLLQLQRAQARSPITERLTGVDVNDDAVRSGTYQPRSQVRQTGSLKAAAKSRPFSAEDKETQEPEHVAVLTRLQVCLRVYSYVLMNAMLNHMDNICICVWFGCIHAITVFFQ
jgi:hypothetical protein